jgi:hypothetical protein
MKTPVAPAPKTKCPAWRVQFSRHHRLFVDGSRCLRMKPEAPQSSRSYAERMVELHSTHLQEPSGIVDSLRRLAQSLEYALMQVMISGEPRPIALGHQATYES